MMAYIVLLNVFTLASLGFYACISELIKDLTKIKGIISLVLTLFALLYVASIQELYSNPTKIDNFTKFLSFQPFGSFYWSFQIIFVRMDYFKTTNLLVLCILPLQAVGFWLIYFFLQGYIGFGVGVSRKLFSTNNRRQTSSLEESLQDGDSKAVLKVKDIKKKFGNFWALNGIDAEIFSNRITCILGHNGAGKTTLINTILGMLSPTEGSVHFNGENVYSSPEVLAGNVGYCTSHDILYQNMTVSEFMMFIAYLKGVQNPYTYVAYMLKKCELVTYASQYTKNLSGGTRRRTSIATAMLGEPSLIFMDEPSSGVDPQNRRELWSLIESAKSEDRAVILTTHHLEEAEYLSEDVIIMDRGQIEIRGSPSDIMNRFGVGYSIIVSNIENNDKAQEIQTQISSIAPEINFDTKNLGTQGRLKVTIPIQVKNLTGKIVSYLEENKLAFGVEGNTLEDAFVELGEEKKAHDQSDKREELYRKAFSFKYKTNYFRLLSALFYRRMVLLATDYLLLIKFIIAIIIPPVLAIGFQGDSKLSLLSICVLPAVTAFIFYMNVSFFA